MYNVGQVKKSVSQIDDLHLIHRKAVVKHRNQGKKSKSGDNCATDPCNEDCCPAGWVGDGVCDNGFGDDGHVSCRDDNKIISTPLKDHYIFHLNLLISKAGCLSCPAYAATATTGVDGGDCVLHGEELRVKGDVKIGQNDATPTVSIIGDLLKDKNLEVTGTTSGVSAPAPDEIQGNKLRVKGDVKIGQNDANPTVSIVGDLLKVKNLEVTGTTTGISAPAPSPPPATAATTSSADEVKWSKDYLTAQQLKQIVQILHPHQIDHPVTLQHQTYVLT